MSTEESSFDMAFQRETCAGAGTPLIAEDLAPSGITSPTPVLLLAPLDPDAAYVLTSQLKAAGVRFQNLGPVLALEMNGGEEAELLQSLQVVVSGPLQHRVKAVTTKRLDDPDDLMLRLMRAELLSDLFDRTDVEWVRAVLEEDRLYSVYHPIVTAADGSLFAHEALVRARHEKSDELAGANHLLYAARKLNLQQEFDRKARICAIRGAAESGIRENKLFVNFMPNTIYDPEICLRSTVEAAEQTGIGMSQIVFEVIETERVECLHRLREIVAFLKRHGAGVALDDLSSGYASLQFLADLVPDYVKIDRDLITMSAVSPSARHTLESIVTLARKLDVKVIAEGVESESQLKVCLDAGVDYLQGFLFALPGCPPQPVTVPLSMHPAARAA